MKAIFLDMNELDKASDPFHIVETRYPKDAGWTKRFVQYVRANPDGTHLFIVTFIRKPSLWRHGETRRKVMVLAKRKGYKGSNYYEVWLDTVDGSLLSDEFSNAAYISEDYEKACQSTQTPST